MKENANETKQFLYLPLRGFLPVGYPYIELTLCHILASSGAE